MKNTKVCWVVLVLLGALMWFLRYGGHLDKQLLQQMITIGPYALLVVHLTLVLMAFQDSVFQGILSLLVPCYSFYWLFIISDAFLIRAIVAALFVGVGLDSLAFYQQFINEHAGQVRDWIASGGGKI